MAACSMKQRLSQSTAMSKWYSSRDSFACGVQGINIQVFVLLKFVLGIYTKCLWSCSCNKQCCELYKNGKLIILKIRGTLPLLQRVFNRWKAFIRLILIQKNKFNTKIYISLELVKWHFYDKFTFPAKKLNCNM